MTLSFKPCSSCNRHIRSDEGSCPFCGTDVSATLGTSASAPSPRARGRFGRAALFAASTLAVAPAACGGTTSDSGGQGTGGATSDTGGTGGEMNTQPVYGAPFTGGSDQGASGSAGFGGELQDDDQVGPVYGAPPVD